MYFKSIVFRLGRTVTCTRCGDDAIYRKMMLCLMDCKNIDYQ